MFHDPPLSHVAQVTFSVTLFGLLVLPGTLAGQTREEKVRRDRAKVEADGFWIYNDLDEAFRQGRQTGKPIIVVLRCIPCEECVKLDDELVDKHPRIRPLLEKFVRARQVSTNGLDLDLFQFDTDQSFAVFLLNADGTIYARFGTRSHRTEWYGDVSLEGLAAALEATLELHADYPENRAQLAGKRGQPLKVPSPEHYPSLRDKYSDELNYSGNVVESCIHCHQIGDAQRRWYRDQGEPIPESILFPYPHPKTIGLTMNPEKKATVREIEPGSPVDQAGWKAGDQIESLDGQPMLSIADVQWVLHNVPPSGGEIEATLRSDGKTLSSDLTLPAHWRRRGDLSWRASSWGLRRMVTGGLVFEPASASQREKLGVAENQMALIVKHVGQYGPHAAAKKAGFRVDDVIIEYDGQRDLMSDAAVLHHGTTNTKPGDDVTAVVLRDGDRKTLRIPMQR